MVVSLSPYLVCRHRRPLFECVNLFVALGDSLVARIFGEVFRCDLCDPCMMLSCAFILVKKNLGLN